MSDRRHPDPDTIELPFIFVPDGAPIPEAARHFRDLIILRARFEPEPHGAAAADQAVTPSPVQAEHDGRFAEMHAAPAEAAAVATVTGEDRDDHADSEEYPFLILSATGAVLAEGSRAALSAQALRLALIVPKNHPVFLAFAGGVLAFATLAALVEQLAQMSGDRNAGLPTGLRARSQRARARATDRAVADPLQDDEWSVHHLIGIDPAKKHLDLLTAATRAGWAMDATENLMILPRTSAAQAKLAAAGIQRPVHDNRHPKWNQEVRVALEEAEDDLSRSGYSRQSVAYARLARQLLEGLQADLRAKALLKQWIPNTLIPTETTASLLVDNGGLA